MWAGQIQQFRPFIKKSMTYSTKMGADSPAKNIPNASKHFRPKCLPTPKSLRFLKKGSLWVSVVPQPLYRGYAQSVCTCMGCQRTYNFVSQQGSLGNTGFSKQQPPHLFFEENIYFCKPNYAFRKSTCNGALLKCQGMLLMKT